MMETLHWPLRYTHLAHSRKTVTKHEFFYFYSPAAGCKPRYGRAGSGGVTAISGT